MSNSRSIQISRKLVMINSAASVANRILGVTVLIWVYQYLIMRVPSDEFAVYPVVNAIMVVAPLFFSLFTGGLARYVIDAYAKSDLVEVTRVISSVFPMIAVGVAAFWLIGLTFAFNMEKILVVAPEMVGRAHLMMALLIISFGIQMLASPFTLGFHVTQRYVELNLLEILREVIRLGLLLWLLFGIGPNVVWIVIGTTVSDLIRTFIVVIRSRQLVPEFHFDFKLFDPANARKLTSFGLWTALGQLGGLMYTNAATIILNLYGTANDVTCFFLGATLYRQVEILILRAIGPLLPVMTAMHTMKDKDRLASTVIQGGKYGLWASLAIATPAVIYSDIFVALYVGEEFEQAAVVIVLFMIVFPFTQATSLLPMVAVAMARLREFYLPAFLFQILGFILMLAISATFDAGAIGVTLALTLTTIGSQLFYYWNLSMKLIGINFTTFFRQIIVPGVLPSISLFV